MLPPSARVLEKIALFRSLFRGREDVFPRYWENAATQKSGYAPAKNGEREKTFLPVTDSVIEDHLRGRHMIGVYPLLPDDTCWFLAADFDEAEWMDDVTAFVSTARECGLAPGVERSRSGNGAHVWFFFSEAVPARAARSLGSQLISRTMRHRHQIKLKSYDRLFPNQDSLPKGGFGNLIALPLQRAAAEKGNTLFLDDEWQPLRDQWGFLRSLRRVTPEEIGALARDGADPIELASTEISGARSTTHAASMFQLSFGDSASATSRTAGYLERIKATLDRTIEISTDGLPSALKTGIKLLAAFANPEFYRKQRQRLSTHDTPRVISCAEDTPFGISLPRGCLDSCRTLLSSHGIDLDLDDRRLDTAEVDLQFLGSLTQDQARAVDTLAVTESGVLVAPPGSGKTVMAVALMAKRRRNTLVIVHRRPLLDQWIARLEMFTGLPVSEIGQIRSGKRNITGVVDVAMVQSLTSERGVDDIVATYGMVVVDECHHVAAVSIERVLAAARSRYMLGLTATPKRRDGLHPLIHMQLGPVRHVVRAGSGPNWPVHRLIVRETTFAAPEDVTDIQPLYALLAASEQRNDLLFDDILMSLDEGRSPLVLTERRDHLDYLVNRLRPFAKNLIVLHGGMGDKYRSAAARLMSEIPPGDERILVATGRYIGEGFDDARLDTLFLTMPVAWKGTIVQYAGRLQRPNTGKREVRVYDYVDKEVPVLRRMFEKRLRGYRALGFKQ